MLTIASRAEPEPPFLPAEHQEGAGLSMAQIFAIVWAHRKISLIIAASLAVVFAGAIKLLPKSYNATATIMVNYEANDPLLGEQAFPTGYMESYIATQIQLIQSSAVLVPVVQELELTKKEEFIAGYNGAGTQTDWAKAQLAKAISLGHPGYTQLIYVTAQSRSATEAALLANTVAKVYLGQQQERLNTPATEKAAKYSEQLNSLKDKVAAAQERVTEFRQRYGLTDIVANKDDVEVSLLNNLEQRYQDAVNSERAALVAKENQQDMTRAASQSTVVQGLRSSLATLQAQLAEYQATYGANHPKVVNLQSQIDSTKKSIDTEMQALGKTSSIDISATRELAAKLKPAVDAQRAKVLSLRRQQDEGGKLLLELDSAQSVYKRALEGYDKVIAAAGGQSSNLRLMNSAEVPIKSTKPNKAKLMILALGAAMFFGLAGPFAFDFFLRRRVRCKDDVEKELGMPVLAEFGINPSLAAEASR
ncbi:MAG: GumC family protein [Steroidobacteraceae bacterium]